MNRKKLTALLLFLILALVLAGAVYAAVSYGSKDDPLITKSYLDEIVGPGIKAEMDKEIQNAIAQLENSPNSGDFIPLTLSAGDKLSCTMGCEVLHRGGELTSEGAFVDTTAGMEMPSMSKAESNHLYVAGEEGAAFVASTEVTLLIKGAYKIN